MITEKKNLQRGLLWAWWFCQFRMATSAESALGEGTLKNHDVGGQVKKSPSHMAHKMIPKLTKSSQNKSRISIRRREKT